MLLANWLGNKTTYHVYNSVVLQGGPNFRMTIIIFYFPRTPCLTGFGNLTMYNWKMSQWSGSPLSVKFLNQEKTQKPPPPQKKNPLAQWNNHPQKKNKSRHHPHTKRLKVWGQTGKLGEISEFFRQLLSNFGLTSTARERGGDPRDTPCPHPSRLTSPSLNYWWYNQQGNGITYNVDVSITKGWPWRWWDAVRQLIWKQ